MRRALIGFALLGCLATAGARSTDTIQITNDGRSIDGAFSPDGSKVAYLSLGKRFAPDGKYYFSGRVRLWDGESSRTLAALGDSKPTSDSPYRLWAPFGSTHWLTSGDYILQGRRPIRVADGACTRVGTWGDWFVMNDGWELAAADEAEVNGAVHCRPLNPVKSRTDEHIRPDQLPDCVPLESDDWGYGHFRRSPRNPDQALYSGHDKHFFGCVCSAGRHKRYLGVADLLTGRLRRLTWGTNYYLDPYKVRWSPDGSMIAYLRQSFHDIDTPITWSTLHVIRPDGSGDRCLAHNVSGYYWVSPTEMVALIGLGKASGYWQPQRQLSVVDLRTGRVRRITKGNFTHGLCDVHDDRYLVLERPVGGSRCQGNLYVIRPV